MRFPHWFDDLPARGFFVASEATAQGGIALEGPCNFSRFFSRIYKGFFICPKERNLCQE